jgi:hypothetical protein
MRTIKTGIILIGVFGFAACGAFTYLSLQILSLFNPSSQTYFDLIFATVLAWPLFTIALVASVKAYWTAEKMVKLKWS